MNLKSQFVWENGTWETVGNSSADDTLASVSSGAVAMFVHSHDDTSDLSDNNDTDASVLIFDCEFIDNMATIRGAMYIGAYKEIFWLYQRQASVIHDGTSDNSSNATVSEITYDYDELDIKDYNIKKKGSAKFKSADNCTDDSPSSTFETAHIILNIYIQDEKTEFNKRLYRWADEMTISDADDDTQLGEVNVDISFPTVVFIDSEEDSDSYYLESMSIVENYKLEWYWNASRWTDSVYNTTNVTTILIGLSHGTNAVTADGNNYWSNFSISLNISNTSFTNNYANSIGGAYYIDDPYGVIKAHKAEYIDFDRNYAMVGASFISMQGYDMTDRNPSNLDNNLDTVRNDATFANNIGDVGTGLVVFNGNYNLECNECQFEHNTCHHYGCALYSFGSSVELNESLIKYTNTQLDGAVYLDYSKLSASGTMFENNGIICKTICKLFIK